MSHDIFISYSRCDLREWTGIRHARCSKTRLEKAHRARGDWEAAVAFMKANDIWLEYSAANRIDEENELVQKAILILLPRTSGSEALAQTSKPFWSKPRSSPKIDARRFGPNPY